MSPNQRLAWMFSVLLGGCALEPDDGSAGTDAPDRSQSALCRNALLPSEQKTALQLIDDICGDTWCEGDNDFAFERLTCRPASSTSPNGGTCSLKLRLIPRDDSGRSYPRTCTTGGFLGFDSLVETGASGYRSLDWNYYLALTECITLLEAELLASP